VVQRDLPDRLKLRIIVCRQEGRLCAGAVFSVVGTTGVYLRGATSDLVLKSRGSYLVQWTFVTWLKDHGLLQYDVNGINPDANPGTYYFKRGLVGKSGRDVEFLGRFQVVDNPVSGWIVRTGERCVLIIGLRRLDWCATYGGGY
jgi:lipid II:glycine glycyltransferase (peptidoglycan interpeptide bridge formation enzyme)